jgi:YVTN family beta-propeller protein
MIMGSGTGGLRYYALSQNLVTATNPTPTGEECNTSPTTQPLGDVTGIEASTDTTDAPIQVGSCPVYAVQTSDGRRLFVLNRGSDTITVINAQNDTLDSCVCPPAGCVNQDNQTYTCHPTLPVSPANGLPHAGPVYAEYIIATSQLIVANYDGNSVSVIDVSLDEFGNDSSTFGTTYTIPVGNSPASVTALYDGSKAYTANQTDGTVTVVNLSSYSVEKTLAVVGHPRTVVSTQNSEYSKIYVASPDSSYLTIIESTPTINDLVDTTIPVEGNIVDVRTSTQNGSGGNANYVSRIPGYGQPCNLPLSEFNPATSANPAVALFDCQVQNVANLK